MEKSTTSLLGTLQNTSIDNIGEYIANLDNTISYSEYFSRYFAENNLTTADIARYCDGIISRSYVYEIINGQKTKPSRDNVILICLASHMDLKTTRRTLEIYNHRPLYPKDERDAVVGIFINNGNFDINAINDRLYELQLPLFNKE